MKADKEKNIFAIWECYMDDLRKKVASIEKKCKKYGCDFTFEEVGEEIREVVDKDTIDPATGEPIVYNLKFILVHAEGTAVINGWEFIASVEHTENGNIFRKALTDVEIPQRYRCSDPFCEHCNSHRMRKGTFIVRNIDSGEFKQVGHNCLMDYTNGMSASFASFNASLKSVFEEAENRPVSGVSWFAKKFDTREVLCYSAETIRLFGYSKAENGYNSTKDRMRRFFDCQHGGLSPKSLDDEVREQMKSVNFNPDSEEANKMVDDAIAWLKDQIESNDYIHNLKVACSLDYTEYNKFGLIVSLFPTYSREMGIYEMRSKEAEQEKNSSHVGDVGDKIDVDVDSIKCVTSWESSYDGYHASVTYIWKIISREGNVFTWKTSKWIDEQNPPKTIKGTVKAHTVYREVRQTELTRCKIERM